MSSTVLPIGTSKDSTGEFNKPARIPFKKRSEAFYAILVAALLIMPLIAAIVLAVIGLMYFDMQLPLKTSLGVWDPIILSWFVTVIIWFYLHSV